MQSPDCTPQCRAERTQQRVPAGSAGHVQESTFFFPWFFQTIGTKPVAHIDQFTPDMLGSAELAEEVNLNGSGKLIKVSERVTKSNTRLTSARYFHNNC